MKKNGLFCLATLLVLTMLCGFAPVPPTGDPRPIGLVIGIVAISGVAVIVLVVWLLLRSKKTKND